MELSAGGAFLILSCLSVGTGCLLVLFHYAQREVSWYSLTTSCIMFLLSVGTVALLPFDIWETLRAADDQPSVDIKVLSESNWEFVYWTSFLLSWFVAPFLVEYEATGGFSCRGRIRAMVRRNAAWSAGYGIFSVVVCVWLILGGGVGLRAWCIACTNAWGALLATVLLGYGLVALPRHLWRLANPSEQLRVLYCAAVSMDETRLSTQFELSDVINETRTEIASRSIQMWDPQLEKAFGILQTTLEECEQLHCELTNGARGPTTNSPHHGRSDGLIEDATRLECLGELHRALKQAGMEARRASCRWDGLVCSCMFLEDLEEQMYPSALEITTPWQGSCARVLFRCHSARSCLHCTVLLWLRTLRSKALRVAGACAGGLGAAMVLGQLTLWTEKGSLSPLALLVGSNHGFWLTQVFCLAPLSYLVYVAYWSVFRLKVAGLYGMYDGQKTDSGSLLWCAIILSRLVAPLCYHFLLLVRVGVESNVDGRKVEETQTAFQEVLGEMKDISILGTSFNSFFPVIVAFLCLCSLLNVYSRLAQTCGLESLEVEWGPLGNLESGDLLTEGRRLVDRERRRRTDDRSLLEELHERGEGSDKCSTMPLRLQIQALIEDGTLPMDWNAHAGP